MLELRGHYLNMLKKHRLYEVITMNKDEFIEYIEQLRKLPDERMTEEIEKLCPICLYLFCKYVVKYPDKFKNRRISISAYDYAKVYFKYFELHTIQVQKEHDSNLGDYYE